MHLNTTEYFIFARAPKDIEVLSDSEFMRRMTTEGLEFKPLVGCYKAEREMSWLMPKHDACVPWVMEQWMSTQESILLLSEMYAKPKLRRAALWFLQPRKDSNVVDLGFLREVPEAEALAQDAWTLEPLTGKYFIAS